MKVCLVYQAGIANVFLVDKFTLVDEGRNAKRLWQGDFYGCEMYALGMIQMGIVVRVAQCNQAGDISSAEWSQVLDDAPFSTNQRPVYTEDW